MSDLVVREQRARAYRADLLSRARRLKRQNGLKLLRPPRYIKRAMSAPQDDPRAAADAPLSMGFHIGKEWEQAAIALAASGKLEDLTWPELTLFATSSGENWQVFDLLAASNTFFAVEPAVGAPAPSVEWADDRFVGLPAITALIGALRQVDTDTHDTLRQREDLGFTAPDPALAYAMRHELQRNHERARTALEQIVSHPVH